MNTRIALAVTCILARVRSRQPRAEALRTVAAHLELTPAELTQVTLELVRLDLATR